MENNHYPFNLVPLPYAYDALEPYIDTKTMELHHDRHLKTYVDNLNTVLSKYPEYQTWSLERLITQANFLPEEIRTPVKNNAGGVYNHNFFFAGMSASGGQASVGDLMQQMNRDFGSFDAFKREFKSKALSVFGSGYAWLVRGHNMRLRVITTANQDTPLTLNLYPLAAIDVWEHAYYLKHYNERAAYIDDWFHVAVFK